MKTAKFQIAATIFDEWREDVVTGEAPTLYRIGTGALARIEIGPKLVTLIGGAPGAGKTAFSMQCVIDGLRLNDGLRVLVCNVEMPPSVLFDRQLARFSGIDAKTIRYRQFDASHADRLDMAMNTLESIADRLCFVRPPFNLANVAASADTFKPHVILLDYIQRIPPPGQHGDRRASIDASMSFLRQFADSGVAVIVVAAVSRQKDSKGRSSYAGDALSLASFRESSELEFGADDAFILVPKPKTDDQVVLRHLKARHTEPRDIEMKFDRRRQSFTPLGSTSLTQDNTPELQTSLEDAWNCAELAADDAENENE